MAIWLERPGRYEGACIHCGWSASTDDLTLSLQLMAAHAEGECRWWEPSASSVSPAA